MKYLIRLVVGISTLTLLGCGNEGVPLDDENQEPTKEVFYIETATVQDLRQSSELKKSGLLLGANAVTVTAQIGGRISAITPQIGESVGQGTRVLTMVDSAGSASFGVERARASLEQARINYEQTLLSLDQQIDETNRSILQAQNQAQTAEIQAQNAQLNGQSSAQLQLQQLEQQLSTARLDLDTKINGDDQTLQNFLASANNILRDARLLYNDVIDDADEILGVTDTNERENDSFERYLSARNTSLKFRTESELRQLINLQNVLDVITITQSSLSADLEYIQDQLQGLIPFLELMEEMLGYTTTGNDFSTNELAALEATIDGLQAGVQAQSNAITTQVNSIESFLRTYEDQQQSIRESIVSLESQVDATRENLKVAQQSSTVSLDSAGLGVESAKATLQNLIDTRAVTARSLSNAITQAEIGLRETQTNAGKFSVEAPIAGSIGEILIDIGQEVSPGTPLFTVTSTSDLEIEIGLTSNEVELIQEEQEVMIDDGTQQYPGTVASITRTASQSLTYKAKITPSQEPSLLGRVVSVVLPIQTDALLLPLKHVTIITTDLGRITTYADGAIETITVDLGSIQGSSIAIQEPLEDSLQIITSSVRTYDAEKYEVEVKEQ